MLINRLIIDNFRSIKHLDVNLGEINALIGPNNAGKSNILSALNIILGERYPGIGSFDDTDFYNHDKSNPIVIQVMFDEPIQTDSSTVFGFYLNFDGNNLDYFALNEHGRVACWYGKPGREIRVTNNMKNEVSLMHLDLNRQAYQQIKSTKWSIYGKLLKYIEESIPNGKKAEFKESIDKIHDANVAPFLVECEDCFKEFISEQTGLDIEIRLSNLDAISILKRIRPLLKERGSPIDVDSEHLGSGIQSALAIAVARTYAKIVKKTLILTIEEPELYLHPHGCRAFYDLINSLPDQNIQVIYSTHERSLINVQNFNHILLVRKKDNETKIISGLSSSISLQEITKIASKFEDNMNEIFFADTIILVEGYPDKIACHYALKKLGIDVNKKNISITYSVGGRDSLQDIAKVAKHFDIPCLALIDKDPSNKDSQRNLEILQGILGKDNVFLQDPDLEGMLDLREKPTRVIALQKFPEWFNDHRIPSVYVELKGKIVP